MNIGIISLGLIGGSLLKALTKTNNTLYAVTRNTQTIKKAKKYTENISSDINILSDCDLVFVASPINKTIEILKKLESVVSSDCIVLDCASVKQFVMKEKYSYKFIGSHPMAGTEFSGYEASFEELFKGAKWVLTPSDQISQKEIDIVSNIINSIGAEVIITNAKEHDNAVALISHMPLLLSQALFLSASKNQLALKLASSGFRDMTRLSMSNLEMANDMMLFNKDNIKSTMQILFDNIDFLEKTKDKNIFESIKTMRKNMYSQDGKNIL